MMVAVLAASALLLIGVVLRATVPPLRWMFVPASVIGGAVGFAVWQSTKRLAPEAAASAADVYAQLSGWPGTLIAIVFAGLLMERPAKSFFESIRGATRQGIMVWIIACGQVLIGVAATWLLIMPSLDVPLNFGQLIEVGWVGGHGTAGTMGAIFNDKLHFPAGRDLGFFFATTGLVWGVLSGIVLINIGVRLGWVRLRGEGGALDQRTVIDPQPMAYARSNTSIIDPLLMQILLLAAAFGIGWLMQQAVAWVGVTQLKIKEVDNLPLLLFTLIGGLVLRELLHALGLGQLIDPDSLKRLTATAMDALIVAAMTTLRIEALSTYLWPALLLQALAAAWCVVCLYPLSKWLLPKEHWFELGLINYGMSTGTTAQGMMLLRMVDRDLESGAAEDYAIGAPLSAPFVGGGIITLVVYPWVFPLVPAWAAVGGLAVLVGGLLAVAFAMRRG